MFKISTFPRVSTLALLFTVSSTVFTPLLAVLDEIDDSKCLSLNKVGDDARTLILKYLDPRTAGRLGTISKSWHESAQDEDLWENQFNKLANILDLRPLPGVSKKSIIIAALGKETVNLFVLGNKCSGPETEAFAQLGFSRAIQNKIMYLSNGFKDYPKDKKKAKTVNDDLAEKGLRAAKIWQIDGYLRGGDGYDKNLSEAIRLANKLGVYKDFWKSRRHALDQIKFEGLSSQLIYLPEPISDNHVIEESRRLNIRHFYQLQADDKVDVANRFLEKIAENGDSEGRAQLLGCLLRGEFGFQKDPQKARDLNSLWARHGDVEALRREIKGYTIGDWGYEKDEEKARALIDESANSGDVNSILLKLQGFAFGSAPYSKRPNFISDYLELLGAITD